MLTVNDDDEKFGLIMAMHFPDVVPGRGYDLNCQKCQDLKGGDCEGKNLVGLEVIKCMEGKINNSIIEVHRSFIQ